MVRYEYSLTVNESYQIRPQTNSCQNIYVNTLFLFYIPRESYISYDEIEVLLFLLPWR